MSQRKGKLQRKILKANLALILVPMIILTIASTVQLSLLGSSIGNDGKTAIETQSMKVLQNASIDVAEYIESQLQQTATDLDRIVEYAQDIFNNNINITETRDSYNQSTSANPPSLAYSSRYKLQVSESYSDYINLSVIDVNLEDALNKSAYIDYIAKTIYKSNPAYVSIRIGFETGLSRVYPYILNGRSSNDDLRVKSWYSSAKAAAGNTFYDSLGQSNVGPALIVSKAIYKADKTLLGCIGLEIELSPFRSFLSTIKVQSKGYVALLDSNLDAIFHPELDTDLVTSSLIDLETDSDEFDEILTTMKTKSSGTGRYSKEDNAWLLSYSSVGKGGFKVAAFLPYEIILTPGNNLQAAIASLNTPTIIIFIVVVIVLILAITLLVSVFSKRITSPINQLSTSLDGMAKGDLKSEIPIEKKHRRNEIGILAQSFQALLITMRLGNQSYYQGDIYLAFKNYLAALELFKTTNNIKGQGICLNNLGNIYRDWGEFDKAKDAYDESIVIADKLAAIDGLSSRLNNRGLLFLSEENWIRAESDFKAALELDERMMSQDRISTRKRNLGVLFLLKGDLEKAQTLFSESLKIDQDIDSRIGQADDYFQMSRLELKRDNLSAAEDHLKQSLQIAKDYGNFRLMKNVLEQLVDIYDKRDETALLHKAQAELAKILDKVVKKKDVIFVIDQSGSMQDQHKMSSARKGALEVYRSTINPNDRVAIIGFHSEINQILPLTQKSGNSSKIEDIFSQLQHTPYQTMFFDAIGVAVDSLVSSESDGQKWIVALTDGQDNCSIKYTAASLADYLRNLKFPLNMILIGVGKELRAEFSNFELIVKASSRGRYIPIYSQTNVSKRIEEAFGRVKEIMASSEIEGFTPEEK